MELTPENVLAVMKEHFASVSDEDSAADVAAVAGKSSQACQQLDAIDLKVIVKHWMAENDE